MGSEKESDRGTAAASDPVEGYPWLEGKALLKNIPDVHHDVFGHLLAPQTLPELMALFEVLGGIKIDAWRGHADETWLFDSSLVRRIKKQRLHFGDRAYQVTETSLREVEKALLERTRRAGLGDDLGELELLARLQHHGAATRLLDCSRSAFVALWFACQGDPETTGVLVGFRLTENALELSTDRLDNSIDDLLAEANGRLCWWQPRGVSRRIPAQLAVFVFGPAVRESWGSIRFGEAPIDVEDTGNVPGAAIIEIAPPLKASLMESWEQVFGFNRDSLFPDFDGFAAAHGMCRPFPDGFPIGKSLVAESDDLSPATAEPGAE